MKLHKIAFVLVIIGGLNWLLAAFHWDIATWGIPWSVLMIVYILIGLSAIYLAIGHSKHCKMCSKGM